ncbi:hypothetical protein BGZ63DRAFT_382759 [Mariannaea sp. PMI_226]|nr:hypothetical protein BGZ63DRAFT_382759 [Mariannaea sp. PMI_226]
MSNLYLVFLPLCLASLGSLGSSRVDHKVQYMVPGKGSIASSMDTILYFTLPLPLLPHYFYPSTYSMHTCFIRINHSFKAFPRMSRSDGDPGWPLFQ